MGLDPAHRRLHVLDLRGERLLGTEPILGRDRHVTPAGEVGHDELTVLLVPPAPGPAMDHHHRRMRALASFGKIRSSLSSSPVHLRVGDVDHGHQVGVASLPSAPRRAGQAVTECRRQACREPSISRHVWTSSPCSKVIASSFRVIGRDRSRIIAGDRCVPDLAVDPSDRARTEASAKARFSNLVYELVLSQRAAAALVVKSPLNTRPR